MLKKLKNFKLIFYDFFSKILPLIEKTAYLKYHNQPFTNSPSSDVKTYENLAKNADNNTYSVEDVDLLEKKNGFAIDRKWLSNLALQTQIVIKKSELNYAHGRILYSVLRKYLERKKESIKKINIVETGTARGFSSICMAKALSDSNCEGTICTFDVLPNNTKMFWNCVADYSKGSQTRYDLLNDWIELVERYIVFVQGFTRLTLPKVTFVRVHFAFLDGAHTYEDVLFEFDAVSKYQKKGDIIVFDDYNKRDFPGIVEAINFIAKNKNYKLDFIQNKRTLRDYAIAEKTIDDDKM